MDKIIRFLLSGLAVLCTAYLLPGVHLKHYGYALVVALGISAANMFVKPMLIVFTIPITIFTFGLFLLVINAFMILLVDYFVAGFSVDGFWWALAFSLILSIVNSMFSDLSKDKRKD